MRVYNYFMHGNGSIFVSPGKDHPDNSDWITINHVDGRDVRTPKMFNVKFQDGAAEVDDSLGKYLIDHGHAQRSKIISRLSA